MRAVVNAAPLIALALVDRLELLRQMFDEILVPAAVYEEVVVKGAGRPGADAVGQADWLWVVPPEAMSTVEPMLLGLDAGEMDVLLLAREQSPDWGLIDERLGRRSACRQLGKGQHLIRWTIRSTHVGECAIAAGVRSCLSECRMEGEGQ